MKQVFNNLLVVLLVVLALQSCKIKRKPAPYPTGPNARGWRWPSETIDGERLSPRGTFGVLHVWLGDTPAPPKTRAEQIAEVVNEVNQQVKGPITFLAVSWKGLEKNLEKDFYKAFLGTENPVISVTGLAADEKQVEKVESYENDLYFYLKTINSGSQPPELSKIRIKVIPTTSIGSDINAEMNTTGGGSINLLIGRAISADNSKLKTEDFGGKEYADVFINKVSSGEFWKHWICFPQYWEYKKEFEPPTDAARSPAGGCLFEFNNQLHLIWNAQARDWDFRIATLENNTVPTSFSPADQRREIISPHNGKPVGSHYCPGVVEFKDKLYMTWKTRGNGELRVLRAESAMFDQSTSHVFRFNYLTAVGPAIVNIGNRKLVVVYRGREADVVNDDNPNLYMISTSDGNNWTEPVRIAGGASWNSSPSLAYLNGRTVLVYKNVSRNRIYLRYSDDDCITWSDAQTILQGSAYSEGFDCPVLLALDDSKRGGEVLWERPGPLFYILTNGYRVASFTPAQTSFDNLAWRKIEVASGHASAIYYDYRFFVVSPDKNNNNVFNLCVSPKGSELAIPRF